MTLPETIKQKYNHEKNLYNRTQEEAIFIVQQFLKKSAIKIHSVQSRVKELDSLIKKAESLEITDIETVFNSIIDVIGIRIICLFLSDIDEIEKLIKASFDVIREDNKIDGSELSSFGYFSIHFICKVKADYIGPRYEDIKDQVFEIQVRTISMDAWANISHYLDYKSDTDIPKDLKKDFFALSGLFYVADTHFEMFFKNKKEQAKRTKKELDSSLDLPINLDSLDVYLTKRFKNRKRSSAEVLSRLVQELKLANYSSIGDIDKKLNDALSEKTELEYDPRNFYSNVGIIRIILSKTDKAYLAIYNEKKDTQKKKK